MSHDNTFNPFNAAIFKAVLTLSRETTEEYVIDDGASVVLPPATKRDLLQKLSHILTSNII